MVDQVALDAFFACEDAAGRTAAVDAILASQAGSLVFLELVKALGEQLTGTDNDVRCKATDLLAQVLQKAPHVLAAKDVTHIGSFFAARLKDWPCLEPAIKGCEAILQLGSNTNNRCPDSTALEIIQAFCKSVNPQSLPQTVRHSCLQLWLTALKAFGVAAASSSLDIVNTTVVSVDGEKDPRCLLLVFQCIQALAAVYQHPGVPQQHLKDNVDNLFDVVSCYFPISFTPPQNDVHAITRENLVTALHTTMCCSPLFAKHCIPLLLEKLSSSLKSAQHDSMLLLVECCHSFGSTGMQDNLTAVWLALKAHLVAPISAATDGQVGKDQVQAQQQMSDKVADTLSECIRGLGDDALIKLVLSDSTVEDLPRHITAVAANSAQRAAANVPVAVAAIMMGAVAAASPHACTLVSESHLPHLLKAISATAAESSAESSALSLSALHLILSRINTATSSSIWKDCKIDVFASVKVDLVAALVKPEAIAVAGNDGGDVMDTDATPTDDEVQLLRVMLWHDLLKLSRQFHLLEADDVKKISQLLAHILLTCTDDGTVTNTPVLWGQTGSNPQAEAMAALRTLLAGSHARLVVDEVLPRLIPAVVSSHGLVQDLTAAGVILKLLTKLAASSADVASQLLQTLVPSVLQQLEKSPTPEVQETVALVLSLLADDVAPTLPSPLTADLASSVVNLTKQMLQLGSSVKTGAGGDPWSDELTRAMVKTLNKLLGLCDAEHQAGLVDDFCKLVEQCHHSVVEAGSSGSNASRALSLSCAAAAALRGGVLSDTNSLAVAQALTDIITANQQDTATSYQDAASISAVALASVVNKWPSAAGQDLERCLEPSLRQLTASTSADRVTTTRKNAYRALSWLARGLALRGHASFHTILSQVVDYLSQASGLQGQQGRDEVQVAWQAAQLFHICTSDTASCSGVGLGRQQHAQMKGLWRQRTFTQCRNALLQQIRATTQTSPGTETGTEMGTETGTEMGTDTGVSGEEKGRISPIPGLQKGRIPPIHGLQFGVACLVQGALLQHVCGELQEVVPALLDSLQSVAKELGSVARDTILSCLLVVSHVLMDKQLRPSLESHVEQLLQLLVSLARLPYAWAVREAAYDCLVATMELPYHYLHPHRQKVLKVAVQGLDDDKRAVREAAVGCRAVWGP